MIRISFLFTGFWLVLWLFSGYPLTLPAILALIAALILDFAPLPLGRDRWTR